MDEKRDAENRALQFSGELAASRKETEETKSRNWQLMDGLATSRNEAEIRVRELKENLKTSQTETSEALEQGRLRQNMIEQLERQIMESDAQIKRSLNAVSASLRGTEVQKENSTDWMRLLERELDYHQCSQLSSLFSEA